MNCTQILTRNASVFDVVCARNEAVEVATERLKNSIPVCEAFAAPVHKTKVSHVQKSAINIAYDWH